jgi:sterol desaturase/sphingolipid hydroxylase (fatty acid hydroxylase superfamily)
VLALYYRIFVTLKFRIVVLTTAVFVILWLMTMEILLGLQCRPISRFWDPDVPGKCLNLVEFTYFTNVTNLVTDIWIFSLPLPVIFKLQMSRNRKIALSFLFSIGLALVLPTAL